MITRHKSLANDAIDDGNIRSAIAHVDSAIGVCESVGCTLEIYEWMLHTATEHGNDVLRAKAFENIILVYISVSLSKDEIAGEKNVAAAKERAREYLFWADSLYFSRNDPFPLVDALLISAEVARADSPGVALGYLSRIVELAETPEFAMISERSKKTVERAKVIIDDIGLEMTLKFKTGKEAVLGSNPEKGLGDLLFAYDAASFFRNLEVAAETARLIAEYYRDIGEKNLAAKWTGRALRWEGELSIERRGDE